jgi:hypothetical protein
MKSVGPLIVSVGSGDFSSDRRIIVLGIIKHDLDFFCSKEGKSFNSDGEKEKK